MSITAALIIDKRVHYSILINSINYYDLNLINLINYVIVININLYINKNSIFPVLTEHVKYERSLHFQTKAGTS